MNKKCSLIFPINTFNTMSTINNLLIATPIKFLIFYAGLSAVSTVVVEDSFETDSATS